MVVVVGLAAVLSLALIFAKSNYNGLILPIVSLEYSGSGGINSSVIGGSNIGHIKL